MSLWRKVDENANLFMWEATCPDGHTPLRVVGVRNGLPPPDYMVKHNTDRFGNDPPKCELGARGHRYLFPGEAAWREYGYTPRSQS